MKIAFVYDRVNKWGGAERVLLALHEIWPQAPLYTAVYHPQTAPWAKEIKVIPSFLNKIPFLRSRHELIPFLTPLAFESFNFAEFDLVISVTSEFAKGIITKPQTLHLCYCLTPTRYLWSGCHDYFRSRVIRLLGYSVIRYLQNYDQVAAQRPDHYLAISQTVRKRIKKYYHRNSEIIYPGIDIDKFKNPRPRRVRQLANEGGQASSFKLQASSFFLIVSRLVPYKRIDLAINAFNQLGWPLKIVGSGKEEKKLKRLALPNIEFLGQLTEEQLLGYYHQCRALIFPQEEDFGLVSLEAQAAGKPVIAYQRGGVRETVIAGKTGLFFKEATPESLLVALKEFDRLKFNSADCRQQAQKFAVKIFQRQFKEFVEKRYQDWKNK